MNQSSEPAIRCVEESPRLLRAHFDADPVAAAQMRTELRNWLAHHFAPDDERVNDVVLAVYEATANAVEFAYLGRPETGSVEVSATRESDRLSVTVSDEGKWHWPTVDPAPASRLRGRGIPLMKSLADHAKLHTWHTGTRVHLVWMGLS
ncbi:MAG TPA: ATP-binding protein [Mycobacterium sp.]|uniref:ATP-binding protein n=1 Tax=Mycobacterium sp. TaxID=1785 RepID=UPI002D513CBB|nr:ATP-binding protein [Mycobacterium sp.]HZU47099.1 ATP-binding protein [Mycobacterium sp.]